MAMHSSAARLSGLAASPRSIAALALLLFSGCPAPGPDADAGHGDDTDSGVVRRDAGASRDDGGLADAGAGDDAGARDDGGVDHTDAGEVLDAGDEPDAGDGPIDHDPTLSRVTAVRSGFDGDDLRVELVGRDVDHDAVSIELHALDARGADVFIFDSDNSGAVDVAVEKFPLEATTSATIDEHVTITGFLRDHPDVHSVVVTLIDARTAATTSVTAVIQAQRVAALGEPCDVTFGENRCGAGLGCRGSPAKCQAASVPVIARLGYLSTSAGARILIDGTDADNDPASVLLEFLDPSGNAVTFDLDGPENPGVASSFVLPATGTANGGKFFVRLDPAEGFESTVVKLAATPTDLSGKIGARVVTALTPLVRRPLGQSCDVLGFDGCVDGALCGKLGTTGRNVCQSLQSLRGTRCTQAPLVQIPAGGVTVASVSSGTSLWDAPSGCGANDPVDRPEGIVRVHLAAASTHVVFRVDPAATAFDTMLYVFAACSGATATPLAPLGCNDDAATGGITSTLELTNLAAGDYVVVVDAYTTGGPFDLEVVAE